MGREMEGRGGVWKGTATSLGFVHPRDGQRAWYVLMDFVGIGPGSQCISVKDGGSVHL